MDQLIENLRAVVGNDSVLASPEELLVYECDGLPQHKHPPRAVVFPESTEDTAEVMRVLARAGVPFTPRGAGTGLSGGALALNQGVVIELARMRKILKIDEANRLAVVQPGVVNLHVSRAVAHLGLQYVPDPSSQPTCTIGGNIAENAGGIHCLKYGTTTDHVLGLRVVLAGGEVVELGGFGREQPGFDLTGVFVGSEGTFGIATEAALRLVPIPPAVRTLLAEFAEVKDASLAVSAIIAAGVMPAALEMMDREIIRAVEASVFAAGLPPDAGAALLIELDGVEAGIDDETERVRSICLQFGARDCRGARDETERKKLWAARKGAFGAIGRISPDSMIQDAVVPRSRLPEIMEGVYRIASRYQLRIANVFHAGDGNLHPLICFDSRSPDEVHRVKEAGRELMETCVRAGGSITGEHGVGLDKRELLPLIFSEADMSTMLRVRAAFDPTGLCNPGKIIPMLRGCGEGRAVASGAVASEPGAVATGSLATSPASEPGAVATGSPATSPASEPGAVATGSLATSPASEPGAVATGSLTIPGPGAAATGSPATPASEVATGSPTTRKLDVLATSPVATAPGSDARAAKLLVQIVGEANVVPSHCPVLVAPGSVAEVCEVMRLAAAESWSVVPAGGGTWLDAGDPLKQVHLLISTKRLNRTIEHEPADLVAVTEAGVTLNDFNDELGRNGQWLPIDPPDDGRATIGGVVATGLGGAQQFGYGSPRRHVIGMRVVLADGSLVKVGGRVVKNVAGYDLSKLFTGSYGTLGVIVEVNFKLRPVASSTKTIMACGKLQSLLSAAPGVMRLFPVAIELLSPALALEADWSDGREPLLLIRFAGSESAVAEQCRTATQTLDEQGCKARDSTNDEQVWRALAALPMRFSESVIWRAGLLPSEVGNFVTRLDGLSLNGGPSSAIWQAGIGDGRIRVVDRLKPDENESVDRIRSLRSEVERLGGALIVEQASIALKTQTGGWGKIGTSANVMQRIKQQLDPMDRLSPARFNFNSA